MRRALIMLAACGHPSKHEPIRPIATVATDAAIVGNAPIDASDAAPVDDEDPAVEYTAPANVPKIRYATWDANRHVMFGETSPGPTVVRTVELPADVSQVDWVGADPVAILHAIPDDAKPAPTDGVIGRITAAGWVPFPKLAASVFTAKQPKGTEKFEPPWWSLVVTASNEIWQGQCHWGVPYDGFGCTEWVYVRREPSPAKVVTKAPVPFAHALQEAPPSTRIKLVPDGNTPMKSLDCIAGAKSQKIPDDAPWGQIYGVRWLRSDPPLYIVRHTQLGMLEFDLDSIFEGCTESRAFQNSVVVPGPNGAFAFVERDRDAANVQIWWKGHHLGNVPGALSITFAPAVSP